MFPSLPMLLTRLGSKSNRRSGDGYGTVKDPFFKVFHTIHGLISFEIGDREAVWSVADDCAIFPMEFLLNKV